MTMNRAGSCCHFSSVSHSSVKLGRDDESTIQPVHAHLSAYTVDKLLTLDKHHVQLQTRTCWLWQSFAAFQQHGYVLNGRVLVRPLAECQQFPHCHAERPHVRCVCEPTETHRLQCKPFHWHLYNMIHVDEFQRRHPTRPSTKISV
jgi:hypothetical protein